jgi:hypothetical protein
MILVVAPVATFGVFRRFQITNLDAFLCFFIHSFPSFLLFFGCCLRWIAGAEQLTPANDALLWNQVIETDQFFLPALGPLIRCLSGGRIFFILRCVHANL